MIDLFFPTPTEKLEGRVEVILQTGAAVTVKVNVLDSVVPPEEAVTVIRVLPAATPVSDPAPSLLPYPLAVAVAVFVGVTV